MLRCCIKWQKSNQRGKRITKNFGLFEIFWFFMEKSWKSWKKHENHEKSWKSWKIKKFRKNFEKIWKIMKNQKFPKSPNIFALYLESSKNCLPLRNPLGSARPTQHCPGSLQAFCFFYDKVTRSEEQLQNPAHMYQYNTGTRSVGWSSFGMPPGQFARTWLWIVS